MKLYEIAKAVGQTNKDIQAYLAEVELPAKSHLSVLTEKQVEVITQHFGGEAEKIAEIQAQVQDEATARRYEQGDLIPCRSVCSHRVIYTSPKTNLVYDWMQFGQIVPVDYIDLLKMYSSQSVYLFRPLIVIEDEDLYLQWKSKLEKIYMDWLGFDTPEELFTKSNEEFESLVSRAPAGLRELLTTTAVKILKGKGDITVRKLEVLDDLCGTALKELYQ